MSKAHDQELLDDVRDVLFERSDMYGDTEDSFKTICEFWNTYLRGIDVMPTSRKLCPEDVALMMALLKIARETFAHKRDNMIDIIGYTVHADRLSEQPYSMHIDCEDDGADDTDDADCDDSVEQDEQPFNHSEWVQFLFEEAKRGSTKGFRKPNGTDGKKK